MVSLLTTTQVAERIGQSVRTLKRWRALSPTPIAYCRVGHKVMYPEEGVQSYLADRQVDSPESSRKKRFVEGLADLARRVERLEAQLSVKEAA